jgi:hypothetical protein
VKCSKHLAVLLLLAGVYCLTGRLAKAACPIVISRLDIPYDHSGGQSTPMAIASFENRSAKRILRAKFSLSILDEQGVERQYPHSLDYPRTLDVGKPAMSTWHLSAKDVDMHRTGEVIYVASVEFEDSTSWTDDGNLRCKYEVNYRGK